MAKDRLRALLDVIANRDPPKIRQEGMRLRVAIDEDIARLRRDRKMIDELLVRYGGSADELTSAERSTKVREAAVAVAESGSPVVTTGAVLSYLKDKGVEFAVKRPASMVGTVLFQMDDFERLGVNQFKYRGPSASKADEESGDQDG